MKNPMEQEILCLFLENCHNFRNVYISHGNICKIFQREFDMKIHNLLY